MGVHAVRKAWIGEIHETPLGEIWVAFTSQGLVAVEFPATLAGISQRLNHKGFIETIYDTRVVAAALAQIAEYLQGKRRDFDLPVDWSLLTPFQSQVLQATFAIPYGQTATYGEIARRIGRPRAARAVGRAQATNPMPLVIPCHRVLGVDGGLHGYGAGNGMATKMWLLQLEASIASK
jgi:methylated-DNA-[protein]-cysteine S-methyltransferase